MSEICRTCNLEIELNPFTNKWEDEEWLYICSPDQGIKERFHQPKYAPKPPTPRSFQSFQQTNSEPRPPASSACVSYCERFGRRPVPGVSTDPEREAMPFL